MIAAILAVILILAVIGGLLYMIAAILAIVLILAVIGGLLYDTRHDPDRDLRRKIHEWEKGGVE